MLSFWAFCLLWLVHSCHPGISFHHRARNCFCLPYVGSSPGGSVVKNPPAGAGDAVQSLSQEDALEEEMATHCSVITRIILWTEGHWGHSPRVRQNWHTPLYWVPWWPIFCVSCPKIYCFICVDHYQVTSWEQREYRDTFFHRVV